MINLRNIEKSYILKKKEISILHPITLKIEQGECVAIQGKSGAGKTTILNIIAGVEKKTRGEYYYKGELTSEYSQKKLAKFRNQEIGYILQGFGLMNEFTVYENIALPLIYSNLKKSMYREKMDAALDSVEMSGMGEKLCGELSGGQQQRVSIARAIVNNPSVLVADEPTGSLDSETGNHIMELLLRLNKEGTTVIIVTHDDDIAKMCTRRLHIKDGRLIGGNNEGNN